MWANWSRLLLVYLESGHTAGVGALGPAVQRLRAALPETALTLWTLAENEGEARRLPAIKRLLLSETEEAVGLVATVGKGGFDAALIFSEPGGSPYVAAYCCYLAGIPVRIGQSVEFGGSVLSHCVVPAFPPLPATQHHLHLLAAVGLATARDGRRQEEVYAPEKGADK